MAEHFDTIIIGAGQAGLTMSYELTQRHRPHVVLERHRIAERWHSERWDSLRFQYPNWSLHLPGYDYSGPDPDAYAPYPEIARLIEDLAHRIAAPVRENTSVTRLGTGPEGRGYVVETPAGALSAAHVVIATGPFQKPRIPDFAADLPARIRQFDAASYRAPSALPPGAVLVVGSGASGCQIADELNRAGRKVYLSASRHRRAPRRYRGKDAYWWFQKLGRFDVPVDSFPGRKFPPSTVVTGAEGGYDINLRQFARDGIILLGRVTSVDAGVLTLDQDLNKIVASADKTFADFIAAADGYVARSGLLDQMPPADHSILPVPETLSAPQTLNLAASEITCVIWATGHRFDFGWIDLPILDATGAPVQRRGVTACPGVYFLGLHWMHNFKSGQLSFVGEDAAYLAEQIDQTD